VRKRIGGGIYVPVPLSEDRGALRRANDSASASNQCLAGVRSGISRSLFSGTAAQDTEGEERPGSPLILALLTPEALLRVGPSPAGQGSRPQAAAPVPRLREKGAGGGFDEAARRAGSDGGERPSLRGVSVAIHFGASF
jgi:hypothetical protein